MKIMSSINLEHYLDTDILQPRRGPRMRPRWLALWLTLCMQSATALRCGAAPSIRRSTACMMRDPGRAAARMTSATEDTPNGLSPSDNELLAYWKAHSDKWATPLRMLDVCAAWGSGELDGLLPSGSQSRVATGETMLTLARALELFDDEKLPVRRRFRNMTPVELAPRWDRVVANRARLQADNRWAHVIVESDKLRAFAKARIEGSVESADASPLASRVVATVLSPALKAAASTRSKADGGVKLALTELLASAGKDPAERWLTAALLADLESEIAEFADVPGVISGLSKRDAGRQDAKPSFAQQEAQRDVEQANRLGVLGVGAAIIFAFLTLQLLDADGGGAEPDADRLRRTLDLMQ